MTSKDFTLRNDPFALFDEWLKEAEDAEPNDPTAMALASVDEDGLPDVRMILLKGHDERGFVFYTNFESAKGRELSAQPKAAAVFHWKSLRRQVRVRGPVTRVSDEEADAYFNSRQLQSRLGACASDQSRPLPDRATLESRVKQIAARFPDGKVPRPPHWSGYRIVPVQIEFWQDGAFRLHDRVQFARGAPGEAWKRERLYP
jgi:pyridoxamine 5'-phosphate oxidase